jgi:hypothetical protein
VPPIFIRVADNEALAQILKDVLNQHGVEARICRNGWDDPVEPPLVDYDGARPACDIWIADVRDLERAQEIVREFEAPAPPAGPGWRCPKCNEQIEPQFETCWKCGVGRK